MRLSLRRRNLPAAAASGAIGLPPIALVHNDIFQPQTSGWNETESEIVLSEDLNPRMLSGLADFSHLIVVFVLHRLPSDRPAPEQISISGKMRGILASRSQLRPNPLGVSVVRLLGGSGRTLRVLGLDALDGTPVLDLKPYIPFYDSVPEASVPAWIYDN